MVTKCIKISYKTKKGKRVTYFRKVKVLASGKYKFLKGSCSKAGKKIKAKVKRRKRKTKRKSRR